MHFFRVSALVTIISLSHAYVSIPYQDPTIASAPPQRKDITTLSNEELNLFVLAMQQWQKVSASVVGGYFQVAGIHGAPHVAWDDAEGFGTTSTGNKNTGYCFHGDQNFYLWHRPYVALFEQQLITTALNISSTWYSPQRATYQAVAATLRLPYWDWAKSGTVPSSIASKQITIVDPTTGQPSTISNPLYSHTLVKDGSLGTTSNGATISVGSGRTTYRGSNYQTNMQSAGTSLKKNTALLFNTANVCWNVFATYNTNEQSQCTGNKPVSLESIHNTIHNTVAGTMANLDVAAFDPIFWLHHCNVDRLGAIWNTIYPSVKVLPTKATDNTYAAGPGTRDENFLYYPFRYQNADTAWWEPNQLYDVRAAGYTYPEIYDQPDSATALSRANAIYGTGRTQQTLSASSKIRREDWIAALWQRQAATSLNTPPSAAALAPYKPILIAQNGSFNEYSVACTVQKSVAPGTSFDLHLFFGDVTSNDYLNAPNRVGGFSVSQAAGSDMSTAVGGTVTITDALLNTLIAGGIKDLKPGTVRRYVRAKLIWRLVTVDGQDIGGNAKSNGLALKVQRSVVTPAAPDAAPAVASPEAIAEVSNNTVAQPVQSDAAATSTVSS